MLNGGMQESVYSIITLAFDLYLIYDLKITTVGLNWEEYLAELNMLIVATQQSFFVVVFFKLIFILIF